MVDTARWKWPLDMTQETSGPFAASDDLSSWAEGVVGRVRDYARDNPDQAVLWALGIGFVLGWKLKPW